MFFSVVHDGNEWYLDLGPDSIILTPKHQFQGTPLAVWSVLLSQRQAFLKNLLARIPITPNQQGAHEVRDEVLSSVSGQDMDTGEYQVSELDDIDFCWENYQLFVDAVFRPGIGTFFPPQRLTTWTWEYPKKTPICSSKSKTRKILCQQQQPLKDQHDPLPCWEGVHLQQQRKIIQINAIENYFNRIYCVCVLIKI